MSTSESNAASGANTRERLLILSGLSGVIAAMLWTVSDMLIVGENDKVSDYPLLLRDYADRIDFFALPYMLSASEPRLAAGALIAALTSSLYLVGAWHLFQVARPASKRWSAVAFGMLIFGFANASLAHASFYFLGMLYKVILVVPQDAHTALLELGNQYNRLLMFPYIASVGGQAIGFLVLAVLAVSGRTLWPRWMAGVVNPASLAVVVNIIPLVMPQPIGAWLGGAGISMSALIVFGLSTGFTFARRLKMADRA